MPVRWIFYPRSTKPTRLCRQIVAAFEEAHESIHSHEHNLISDEVLAVLAPGLKALGFKIESGKRKDDKISVPVLFGEMGVPDKCFDADAHHEGETAGEGFVLEIEAGRAVSNNQFLKDLFQACMMADVAYLGIAVRQIYDGGGRNSADYDQVCRFFETLYASDRLRLPLKGILLIGY